MPRRATKRKADELEGSSTGTGGGEGSEEPQSATGGVAGELQSAGGATKAGASSKAAPKGGKSGARGKKAATEETASPSVEEGSGGGAAAADEAKIGSSGSGGVTETLTSGGLASLSATQAGEATSTDTRGVGLLKRILYVIPHPPTATTIGELRTEAASRYSVPRDNLSVYDPRSGVPGTLLPDDTSLDTLDSEIRVMVQEAAGTVKEWVFWFDRGGQRSGITNAAHQSIETPAQAAAMSAPSVVDMATTAATGVPTATVPVAGLPGEAPSIVVATAPPGGPTQTATVDASALASTGGLQEAGEPSTSSSSAAGSGEPPVKRSRSRSKSAERPGSAEQHNTRLSEKEAPGHIARDVAARLDPTAAAHHGEKFSP